MYSDPMDRTAFLSVRLPPATRNRVKALAAGRGQTVQDLVGDLVACFLAEQDRRPLALAEVITQLREQAPALRQRHVAKLWVFGAVARGDAGLDSDLDLIVKFAADATILVTDFASLQADLAGRLGVRVNLTAFQHLQSPSREQAERDAVEVF